MSSGGPFLPLAIILYWFANNIWTFGQQHYVFGKIEKEEEAKKLEAQERRAANAPPPGAKPNRQRKAQGALSDDTSGEITSSEGTEISDADGAAVDGKPTGTSPGKPASSGRRPHAASGSDTAPRRTAQEAKALTGQHDPVE